MRLLTEIISEIVNEEQSIIEVIFERNEHGRT